jgi:hypothetical protein
MPVALEPILSLLSFLDAMDGVSENVDKRALVGKLYRELENFIKTVLDIVLFHFTKTFQLTFK